MNSSLMHTTTIPPKKNNGVILALTLALHIADYINITIIYTLNISWYAFYYAISLLYKNVLYSKM